MKTLDLTPVLLASDNASILGLGEDNELLYAPTYDFEQFNSRKNFKHRPQHLYLTSNREIKEGDWAISNTGEVLKISYKGSKVKENVNAYCKKIEFTTDPKLIVYGVPAVPEKIFINCDLCGGGLTPSMCSKCGGKDIKVNFLEEFCKRYNGKPKGVDAEKLAIDRAYSYLFALGYFTKPTEEGKIVEQLLLEAKSLQDNDKRFSLEDIRKAYQKGALYGDSDNTYYFDNLIQSLTKEQPKGVEMYCEMEHIEAMGYIKSGWVIKLINGQPIIHFK